MLESARLDHMELEFTTACNLNCVYCNTQGKNYTIHELDLSRFAEIVDFLVAAGRPQVSVFGHGETTCRKDWHRYCDTLLQHGLRLTITTNLAKNFSEAEIETLSRFALITISVDTVDPMLFAALRKGAKLGRILNNMKRIRECAEKDGRRAPELRWNCVVSSAVVSGLDRLVTAGCAAGVGGFVFTRYNEYGHNVPGAPELLPVAEMPEHALPGAVASLQRAMRTAKALGAALRTEYGLMEQIESRITGGAVKKTGGGEEQGETGEKPTRYCLEPWANMTLRADGRVGACCSIRDLGRYEAGVQLQGIINNAAFQRLREELVTGRLCGKCLKCPYKAWTDVETLRNAVAAWMVRRPDCAGELKEAV